MDKFITTNKKLKQTDQEQKMLNQSSGGADNCYILDGQFFTVIKKENKNISAQCQLCSKVILGQRGSTGNFLSHIKVRVGVFIYLPIILRFVNRDVNFYIDNC